MSENSKIKNDIADLRGKKQVGLLGKKKNDQNKNSQHFGSRLDLAKKRIGESENELEGIT